ncbi:MAG: glycoside hydrolase family 5 protein [Rectinemataceae bacterium]
MKLRLSIILSLCIDIALSLVPACAVDRNRPGLPSGRLNLLARGINLNAWFTSWANPAMYAIGFRSDEAAFLEKAGFTFCRLPLAPDLLFDPAHPATPRPEIRFVDRAVRLLLDAGLAVVFDPIHGPSSSSEWESKLCHDPLFLSAVETYWESLAEHYAAISSDRIFFEVMNEPHLSAREKVDPSWWQPVQAALVAAIRRGAPSNTIIATGERWGGIDGLVELEPLSDPDVVYSFHWYDPFIFTFQGVTSTVPVQAELAGIPYPSSPAAVASVVDGLADPKARAQVLRYGAEKWEASKIEEGLKRAADWAASNHVAVFCGEFGVYRQVAPVADRLRWIDDVRRSLEALGIGWSMWDYETDFGLVTFSEPSRRRGPRVDSGCLAALGLDPSQNLAPDSGGVTAADFASGAARSLDIPVWAMSRLWTRDAGTGDVSVQEGMSGVPVALSLDYNGSRDWSLGSGLRIPVHPGEELLLSSQASLEGPGSLYLELVARDAHGEVLDWSYARVKAGPGPMRELRSDFFVGPGIFTLEPCWSGSGPAKLSVEAFRLDRRAAAAGMRRPGQ